MSATVQWEPADAQPFIPALCPRGETDHKYRVAVFGSFLGGYHVLRQLLTPPLSECVEVVGVATDDPDEPFIHASVRLWKYDHSDNERWLVRHLAVGEDIPVYSGRINTDAFVQKFTQGWKPDLCLMATFGQKIPRRLFEFPKFRFYNFHHSDIFWPSYPGPDPIAGMVRDGKTHVVLTLHEVNEVLDGGRFVARSHPVPLPADANAVKVHRRTWPQMGSFIQDQVLQRFRGKHTYWWFTS